MFTDGLQVCRFRTRLVPMMCQPIVYQFAGGNAARRNGLQLGSASVSTTEPSTLHDNSVGNMFGSNTSPAKTAGAPALRPPGASEGNPAGRFAALQAVFSPSASWHTPYERFPPEWRPLRFGPSVRVHKHLIVFSSPEFHEAFLRWFARIRRRITRTAHYRYSLSPLSPSG